jgi:hypothetical protein
MSLLTNLVAYYNMEGNSTDVVAAQNGTDTAITYSSANGKINQGAGMNGTSSYIYLPDSAKGGNSMALSMWFYLTSSSYAGDNLYSESLDAYFNIFVNGGGVIGMNQQTTGATYASFTSAGGLFTDHQWVHVVAQYDSVTGYLSVYVNNVQVINVFRGGNQVYGNGAPNQANDNCIGVYAYFNGTLFGGFFPGNIDEVGIWNRALSSSEITQLYNSGSGLTYPFTGASGNFLELM